MKNKINHTPAGKAKIEKLLQEIELLGYENLLLSRKWQRVFKGERLGGEMVRGDEGVGRWVREMKNKYEEK